jgi:hypothetical protein
MATQTLPKDANNRRNSLAITNVKKTELKIRFNLKTELVRIMAPRHDGDRSQFTEF